MWIKQVNSVEVIKQLWEDNFFSVIFDQENKKKVESVVFQTVLISGGFLRRGRTMAFLNLYFLKSFWIIPERRDSFMTWLKEEEHHDNHTEGRLAQGHVDRFCVTISQSHLWQFALIRAEKKKMAVRLDKWPESIVFVDGQWAHKLNFILKVEPVFCGWVVVFAHRRVMCFVLFFNENLICASTSPVGHSRSHATGAETGSGAFPIPWLTWVLSTCII